MPQHEISLQPKQFQLLELLTDDPHPVIGAGGGRGAAKSSGADRAIITMMYEQPGLVACLVMRTWVKQVVPFHLEQIRRDFPWLAGDLKVSPPAMLRIGRSRLEFKYAENYDQVEEAFRSGNYDLIAVDQAEQFTWRELVEIRKAARSRGGRQAKLLLLFNMRGACIQELRRVFHLKEIGDPTDYEFLKFNPWDNVEWVRAALEADGLTDVDYYSWTDQVRKEYAAVRGPYTKQLATDDPVISKADWDGDWDSIEGTYFANSFDLGRTMIDGNKALRLRKNWAVYWMAQDWGKSHFCVTYWAFRVALSPLEIKDILNWTKPGSDEPLAKPINITVIYREHITSEQTPTDVGVMLVNETPQNERSKLKAFFLSPECVTDDLNSIGNLEGKELRKGGMPYPIKADNERKGGYGLMSKLFKATKGCGYGVDQEGHPFQYDDAVLITSDCPELLKSIPMLMRDPKDIDDVLKTDKSQAKIEQDCGDSGRYLLKSMLAPKKKTDEDIYQEKMDQSTPEQRALLAFRHQQKKLQQQKRVNIPSWKGNLR